jgi:CBS domain containing-hemolysin-like protein
MAVASYAVPQLLYRRTRAQWLVPLTPLLRALAWTARPCVAALGFFQSLVELANPSPATEEAPTPAENIEALISAGAEEGLIGEQD